MAIFSTIGKETRRVAAISYVDFFTEFSYSKTREKASATKSGAGSKKNEGFLYSHGRAFRVQTEPNYRYLVRVRNSESTLLSKYAQMIKYRFRIGILTALGIVAVAALLFAWVASERRKRIATLNAELHSQEDRASWAERMQRNGYLSKAKAASEKKKLAEVQSQLKALGAATNEP